MAYKVFNDEDDAVSAPVLQDFEPVRTYKDSATMDMCEEFLDMFVANGLLPGDLLKPLLGNGRLEGEKVEKLVVECTEKNSLEPNLIEMWGETVVVGDLHGNLSDLLGILMKFGLGAGMQYLFLGDFMDRGRHSLEVFVVLLVVHLCIPSVRLLRGNHESVRVNSKKGYATTSEFRDAMGPTFNFWAIEDFYKSLPLAALIDKRFFCLHGYIPNTPLMIEEIATVDRRFLSDLVLQMLWNDPATTEHTKENEARGKNLWQIGETDARAFVEANRIECIIRGHQMPDNGFLVHEKHRTLTIFSASHYNGHENPGTVGVVKSDGITIHSYIKGRRHEKTVGPARFDELSLDPHSNIDTADDTILDASGDEDDERPVFQQARRRHFKLWANVEDEVVEEADEVGQVEPAGESRGDESAAIGTANSPQTLRNRNETTDDLVVVDEMLRADGRQGADERGADVESGGASLQHSDTLRNPDDETVVRMNEEAERNGAEEPKIEENAVHQDAKGEDDAEKMEDGDVEDDDEEEEKEEEEEEEEKTEDGKAGVHVDPPVPMYNLSSHYIKHIWTKYTPFEWLFMSIRTWKVTRNKQTVKRFWARFQGLVSSPKPYVAPFQTRRSTHITLGFDRPRKLFLFHVPTTKKDVTDEERTELLVICVRTMVTIQQQKRNASFAYCCESADRVLQRLSQPKRRWSRDDFFL